MLQLLLDTPACPTYTSSPHSQLAAKPPAIHPAQHPRDVTPSPPSLLELSGAHHGLKGRWASNALISTACTAHRNVTLLSLILIISGDVEPNPGPVQYPCGCCHRPVASNHRAVLCDKCDQWFHINCAGMTPKIYTTLSGSFSWICPTC